MMIFITTGMGSERRLTVQTMMTTDGLRLNPLFVHKCSKPG
jgi:hypothetical protein